jgi:hypothetical protein
MAMETFDASRQRFGQLLCEHSEPAAWGAGIVELGFYLTVFWVDSKAARDRMLGEMGYF